jgi:hypothetical protein
VCHIDFKYLPFLLAVNRDEISSAFGLANRTLFALFLSPFDIVDFPLAGVGDGLVGAFDIVDFLLAGVGDGLAGLYQNCGITYNGLTWFFDIQHPGTRRKYLLYLVALLRYIGAKSFVGKL